MKATATNLNQQKQKTAIQQPKTLMQSAILLSQHQSPSPSQPPLTQLLNPRPQLPSQRPSLIPEPHPSVQRMDMEEDDLLQGKFIPLQKMDRDEEELLQGKFVPTQQQENRTGLPDNLKSGIESLSGLDMSDVRVHYNSTKPTQLNALAYAQGADIHIGPGQEKHLPHEAWHTVQQRQGRVKPTMMLGKTQINDDVGLEREADMMATKVIQMLYSEKNVFEFPIHFQSFQQSAQATTTLPFEQSSQSQIQQMIKQNPKMVTQYKLVDDIQNMSVHNRSSMLTSQTVVQKAKSRGTETDNKKNQSSGGWIYKLLKVVGVLALTVPGMANPPMVRASSGPKEQNLTPIIPVSNMAPYPVNQSHSWFHNNNMNNMNNMEDLGYNADFYQMANQPDISTKPSYADPVPTDLPIQDVEAKGYKSNDDAGASGGGVAKKLIFQGGGEWGQTFLKDVEANSNVGKSTAYATEYNTRSSKRMLVTVPDVAHVKRQGKQQIASEGLKKGYKCYEKMSKNERKAKFNDKARQDYAALSLMVPVADVHRKNFGFTGEDLTCIDVDTFYPYMSHWYSRGIDRFDLPEERFYTSDVGSNYLSQGKAQDHLYYNEIDLQEMHIVQMYKDFCNISEEELAEDLKFYPLQGKASQKLVLHVLKTQQKMFKEAFENFTIDITRTPWKESGAYKKLKATIHKYEENNEFPYTFKVEGKTLDIQPNPDFKRPKDTELWQDKGHNETNPELMEAVKEGYFGDVNLRLSNSTAINPEDIFKMIHSAKKYTRSIGAGNPVVELVARLVLHPSFDNMSKNTKSQVKSLFAPDRQNGNPLRQAFFPRNLVGEEPFQSDNFYEGDKLIVKEAYEKISKL